MKNRKFKITPGQSNIEWVGKKVTGAHNGTIAIKEGQLILNEGELIGGTIIVDTRSIKVLDVTDPATNAQFSGHLASDDFFSSNQFPEATLEIISVVKGHVKANLTIKGITKPVEFKVLMTTIDDLLTASAKLVIDRTEYDMKFRSGNFFKDLGDTLIYNEFELAVLVTAQVAQESVAALS